MKKKELKKQIAELERRIESLEADRFYANPPAWPFPQPKIPFTPIPNMPPPPWIVTNSD